MFGLFKKKTEMQKFIAEHGYDDALEMASQAIIDELPNRVVAYEFMLQELDGASQGNDISRLMANTSGILPAEFKGALSKDIPEINVPHDYITNLSLQLASEPGLMTKFRLDVGSKVMECFKLGCKDPRFDAYGALFESDEKNYIIKPNGFMVHDFETKDVVDVVIREGAFSGEVISTRYKMKIGLVPWSLDANPFQDDHNFCGSGNSSNGFWEFSVSPAIPFSEILERSRNEYELSMDYKAS